MNILKINISNINIDDLETKLINNYNIYESKKIDYYVLENFENLSLETLSFYMSRLKNILGGWNNNDLKKRKYLLLKNINNIKYLSDLCNSYNYDLLYTNDCNLNLQELKELCYYPCTLLIENSEKSVLVKQLLEEEFDKLQDRVKIISYIKEDSNYYLQDKFLNKYDFQDNILCYYNEDCEEIVKISCKDFASEINKINYANYEKEGNIWLLYKTQNYVLKINNKNAKYSEIYLKLKKYGKSNIKELYSIIKELKKIIKFVGNYKTEL